MGSQATWGFLEWVLAGRAVGALCDSCDTRLVLCLSRAGLCPRAFFFRMAGSTWWWILTMARPSASVMGVPSRSRMM